MFMCVFKHMNSLTVVISQLLARVLKETGVHISVVDQSVEGRLG